MDGVLIGFKTTLIFVGLSDFIDLIFDDLDLNQKLHTLWHGQKTPHKLNSYDLSKPLLMIQDKPRESSKSGGATRLIVNTQNQRMSLLF